MPNIVHRRKRIPFVDFAREHLKTSGTGFLSRERFAFRQDRSGIAFYRVDLFSQLQGKGKIHTAMIEYEKGDPSYTVQPRLFVLLPEFGKDLESLAQAYEETQGIGPCVEVIYEDVAG